MLTIFEALTWAQDTLKATLSPVQNPKLDAQVLLAHVINKGTAYLFAHGDDPLPPEKAERFQRLVTRRARHEPIAYLVGEKEFFGRPFTVNPHVLIPRPDTEVLVEAAKKLVTDRTLIVDVGTGSGAIAVTLALETGRPVVAIDVDPQALSVAKHNAETLGARRIVFLQGHLVAPLLAESNGESLGEHVVICANLPYIRTAQYEALDPDVKAYEPQRALVSGIDGLDHYDALFAQIAERRFAFPKLLHVLTEIDPGQKDSAPALIRAHFPSAKITRMNDLSDRPRVIIATL